MAGGRRALHYVFKIGNRELSYKFFSSLGMKVLRHEEFQEGCKATCNGPYQGKWSKTMMGYGDEADHFVIELTYNYEIGSYRLGNDYRGIWIKSSDVFNRIRDSNLPVTQLPDGQLEVKDPDGRAFFILPGEKGDPVWKVAIGVSDLQRSTEYWHSACGMDVMEKTASRTLLSFGSNQCALELHHSDAAIDRGTAFGRIAFACPTNELHGLQAKMKEAGETILTPLVALDTPGKATVHVVILADPDGHEICFVGDEAFAQLSLTDPHADDAIRAAIVDDESGQFFADGKAAAK